VTNPSNPCIAQTFKPGDKLAGCFTLKELLAPQGFCCVWLAHDEELNKDLLLHFVPDSVLADGRAMTELKNEAKRNRQLIHPRIARVHDLVTDEKWAAISMDYVPGETYQALQEKRDKRALSPGELTPAIAELCQTIEDAHRIELFHRDLAPDNLIATANGLMVQKFGISRVILDSLARGGQQLEGARDLAYISPQQLDGERPSRTDDIYSLGATLYDLLTGRPPFSGGDIIAQIRKTVPAPVSERRAALEIGGEPVPKAWDDAIAACLAKNFEERPKSAAELAGRIASKAAPAPALAPAAAGAAGTAVAAATASAAASEPPSSDPKKPEPPAAEAPKTAAPEPEGAAPKQGKRPWNAGPGKTPVIAEATILSNTPVSKGETRVEPPKPGAAGKPPEPPTPGGPKRPSGATTPSGFPLQAFVEVDGDKRPKGKSPAALIIGAAVVVVLVLAAVVYQNSKNSSQPPDDTAAATTGSNGGTAAANTGATTPPAPVEAASPSPSGTPAPAPVNLAAASATPAAPPAVAESPSATPSVALIGSMTDEQAQQALADKAKAVDQAKAALAAAEKASQDKAAAQTQAAAALQDLQAQSQQKADAAATAKKTADDASAALKQQQDTLQKAQADADAAQKEAAAKAQAAAQLQKSVQDAQAAAQQQQTAAQQAQADADQLAKTIVDRQKAAGDAAKAAADAEKARQQQAQAVGQAQADLNQFQASLDAARNSAKAQEAARQAAQIKAEREAETERLAAQAAAATKAAADAEKALEVAKKAVADAEKAQADAEAQAEAAKNGTLVLPAPSPTPESTPSATPPTGAEATPATSPGATGPTLSVHAPNPNLKVDQALINSLGMRFAPVGKVFFCVWLTRVQDFAAFAKDTSYQGTAWQDPGFKQGPDHPVVNVTWNDANQFCLWLTQKEHRQGILNANQTYRLPTDLEWSNAVGLPHESGRTPEDRDMDVPDVYPWGTQWPPPPGAGNYTGEETDSDVAIKGYNDGFAWTSPVGSFNANKFGLYDMGGNVWEWCEDWLNGAKKSKVLRGGSWYNGALRLSLLSSCRIHAPADQGTDNYGFRVVISEEMSKGKRGEE